MAAMRSVMFVDRLALEFTGSHFSHALALGDVDADNANELIVGNVDGILAIFKGDRSVKPWKRGSGLGTITCVGVGDLFNSGKNALLCINAEGICHIFTVDAEPATDSSRPGSSPDLKSSSRSIKPAFSQKLELLNAKVILIANIALVGNELYVGHMDRKVACYQWKEESNSLQLIQKWTLSGQIGSLSVTMTTAGALQLLVSQPGGTYVPLCYSSEAAGGSPHPSSKRKPKLIMNQLETVGNPQRRCPTASTEVIGHISNQSELLGADSKGNSNTVALCTLDGTLRLLKDEKKKWELQVDHSLFAIQKLDVTGSGEDEIVVCAWDGMTYIVNQQKNIVKFQFEENVSAFCAGYYGLSNGESHPCLVYSTFSSRIYLYYNISLPSIASSNLLLTMGEFMSSQRLPAQIISELEHLNDAERQALLHKCLYGHLDTLDEERTY